MNGRWTITARDGSDEDHSFVSGPNCESMPVVPCDDAAIERGAAAMVNAGVLSHREVAELILRAAGETS